MKSNKQERRALKAARITKAQKLKRDRAEREKQRVRDQLRHELATGQAVPVDPSKVNTCSALHDIPHYYRDRRFRCKDCGQRQTWTAEQQRQWHEDWGGVIEAKAVRCRPCRLKRRAEKVEARRLHLEGLARKKKPKN